MTETQAGGELGPPSREWTSIEELRLERLREIVEAAIADMPEGETRDDLQEALEDGDYDCERTGPETVTVYAGPHEVGEFSIWLLQRPDDPSRN